MKLELIFFSAISCIISSKFKKCQINQLDFDSFGKNASPFFLPAIFYWVSMNFMKFKKY